MQASSSECRCPAAAAAGTGAMTEDDLVGLVVREGLIGTAAV
ncbi:MAG TPA: hypothetical protein VF223_24755 [Trebonia sp.]